MKKSGYALKTTQDAFFRLPEEDQDVLAAIHEKEAYALNDTMKSRVSSVMEYKNPDKAETIEINGVRLEAHDFGAPTLEQIEQFGLVELKDGDEADSDVPQYGSCTIDDYDLFKRAYPHYADLNLDETQAREMGIFPVTIWGYNKLARKLMLGEKREPNDGDWGKLREFTREQGGINDVLIKAMNAWFVGSRCPYSKEFCNMGVWAIFGVSDDFVHDNDPHIPYLWLDRDGPSVTRSSMLPECLIVIRAIASQE